MTYGRPTDTPAWARQLPSLADLQYLQALLTVIGLLVVGSWIAAAIVRDPRSIERVAKKKLGT